MSSGLVSRALSGAAAVLERPETIDRLDDDRTWLAAAMGLAATIAVVYVLTHPYPALGGGLFLAIAERILANGYRLPTTIPHYTSGGLPFAYPPLIFYGLAALLDIGISPLALARGLPGLVTVLYLIPFHYLARELLDSVRRAGLATVILAVTPAVLEWHLSAGGIVRAPTLFLLLSGLYCGVKLFRTHERRWLAFGVVLFGLTFLSHPIAALVFGSSYLLFYVAYDRSLRGIGHGTIVAIGGLSIASPWWLQVVSAHGVGVFTSAAGTHGGFAGGLTSASSVVPGAFAADPAMWPWFLLVGLGGMVLLWRRTVLLPVWVALLLVLTSKLQFAFVPGVMIVAVLVADLASLGTDRTTPSLLSPSFLLSLPIDGRTARALSVAILGVLIVTGGVYAAGASAPLYDDDSLPSYVDDEDVGATAWVVAETPADATFVVLGDAAEWFPLLADRTLLVGPWGVEWTTSTRYAHQRALYRAVSTCDSARCLTNTLRRNGVRPGYVYVPTDAYTVEHASRVQPAGLARSLAASDRYRLAFANEGVSIFRVTDR